MAFKINNPFTNKDERSGLNLEQYMPQSFKDERSAFNTQIDERLGEMEESVENMVRQRGKSTYFETMRDKRSNSKPVFTNSKEKKYPYLMSIYNFEPIGGSGPSLPSQCDPDPTDPRNQDVIACETWHQDNYNRTHSLQGVPRGVLKDMEHDAKLSSEIMEEALAMDYTEENYVKNLTGLISRLQNEKGGFKLGGSKLPNNTKSVAWQTKQQILQMIDDHNAAVAAQDSADNKRIMQFELNKTKNELNNLFNEDGSLKAFDNI
tara:strand:- start:173 stop:961 length:789 start_codon:yes stop_codon:yes gene_type:complete